MPRKSKFNPYDYVGKKFSNWEVLGYSHCEEYEYYNQKTQSNTTIKHHYFRVKCLCGTLKTVGLSPLRKGRSKSCGCMYGKRYLFKATHGDSRTRLHGIYCKMIYRCYNEEAEEFKHYGGRGITVCAEWLKSYEHFKKWALKNGYTDKLSIDRKNNNGDYSPDNCRWVNQKVQNNNTRQNVHISAMGMTKTAAQWSEILGVRADTLRSRKRKGWSDDAIIKTPVKLRNKPI
ncbi:hypothetical protein ACFOU0_12350 [Salinicoccus sesuvii]|uniref:AP2 domain-containing protein n=1 Tax=Salinicoccus sesuvii TaxID=868281 RepID=A0ABV7N923_9STAP